MFIAIGAVIERVNPKPEQNIPGRSPLFFLDIPIYTRRLIAHVEAGLGLHIRPRNPSEVQRCEAKASPGPNAISNSRNPISNSRNPISNTGKRKVVVHSGKRNVSVHSGQTLWVNEKSWHTLVKLEVRFLSIAPDETLMQFPFTGDPWTSSEAPACRMVFSTVDPPRTFGTRANRDACELAREANGVPGYADCIRRPMI